MLGSRFKVSGKLPTYPSPKLTLTLSSHSGYPGYQRFFSRAAGSFGVGRFRAGHYKDLTETGNRARKVSGTQGTFRAKCWLKGGVGGQFPRNVN